MSTHNAVLPVVAPLDFEADAPRITAAQLSRVTMVAQQLLDTIDDLAAAEADVKRLSEAKRRLEEQELPMAMEDAQMQEFKTTSGKVITVKEVIAGAPPKERLPQALSWLRNHHHDGIIKRDISLSVKLPKGQDKLGDTLVNYLSRLKLLQRLGVTPKDEPSLHYQTFGAWAREMYARHKESHLEGGEKFVQHVEDHRNGDSSDCVYCGCPFCNEEDVKLLGVYIGKKAEVKIPKQ